MYLAQLHVATEDPTKGVIRADFKPNNSTPHQHPHYAQRVTSQGLQSQLAHWRKGLLDRVAANEPRLVHLEEVDLSKQQIGNQGFDALLCFLREFTISVKVLKFYRNQLADAAMDALVDYLQAVRSPVHEIHLSDNYITEFGLRSVLRAIAVLPWYPRVTFRTNHALASGHYNQTEICVQSLYLRVNGNMIDVHRFDEKLHDKLREVRNRTVPNWSARTKRVPPSWSLDQWGNYRKEGQWHLEKADVFRIVSDRDTSFQNNKRRYLLKDLGFAHGDFDYAQALQKLPQDIPMVILFQLEHQWDRLKLDNIPLGAGELRLPDDTKKAAGPVATPAGSSSSGVGGVVGSSGKGGDLHQHLRPGRKESSSIEAQQLPGAGAPVVNRNLVVASAVPSGKGGSNATQPVWSPLQTSASAFSAAPSPFAWTSLQPITTGRSTNPHVQMSSSQPRTTTKELTREKVATFSVNIEPDIVWHFRGDTGKGENDAAPDASANIKKNTGSSSCATSTSAGQDGQRRQLSYSAGLFARPEESKDVETSAAAILKGVYQESGHRTSSLSTDLTSSHTTTTTPGSSFLTAQISAASFVPGSSSHPVAGTTTSRGSSSSSSGGVDRKNAFGSYPDVIASPQQTSFMPGPRAENRRDMRLHSGGSHAQGQNDRWPQGEGAAAFYSTQGYDNSSGTAGGYGVTSTAISSGAQHYELPYVSSQQNLQQQQHQQQSQYWSSWGTTTSSQPPHAEQAANANRNLSQQTASTVALAAGEAAPSTASFASSAQQQQQQPQLLGSRTSHGAEQLGIQPSLRQNLHSAFHQPHTSSASASSNTTGREGTSSRLFYDQNGNKRFAATGPNPHQFLQQRHDDLGQEEQQHSQSQQHSLFSDMMKRMEGRDKQRYQVEQQQGKLHASTSGTTTSAHSTQQRNDSKATDQNYTRGQNMKATQGRLTKPAQSSSCNDTGSSRSIILPAGLHQQNRTPHSKVPSFLDKREKFPCTAELRVLSDGNLLDFADDLHYFGDSLFAMDRIHKKHHSTPFTSHDFIPRHEDYEKAPNYNLQRLQSERQLYRERIMRLQVLDQEMEKLYSFEYDEKQVLKALIKQDYGEDLSARKLANVVSDFHRFSPQLLKSLGQRKDLLLLARKLDGNAVRVTRKMVVEGQASSFWRDYDAELFGDDFDETEPDFLLEAFTCLALGEKFPTADDEKGPKRGQKPQKQAEIDHKGKEAFGEKESGQESSACLQVVDDLCSSSKNDKPNFCAARGKEENDPAKNEEEAPLAQEVADASPKADERFISGSGHDKKRETQTEEEATPQEPAAPPPKSVEVDQRNRETLHYLKMQLPEEFAAEVKEQEEQAAAGNGEEEERPRNWSY
ncbi:unnamed protein product [Amoebophrya sp. A120]|nr:unnamed protein product [Amoebophrya sp. A120]|eukprot:GSA120T00007937001.1